MRRSANKIVAVTMDGKLVYGDQTGKMYLGGDCHYIPSVAAKKENEMKRVAKKAKAKKKISRHGVKILAVDRNGPSGANGIREGDVITHVDGKPIYFSRAIGKAVRAFVGAKLYGKVIKIGVRRGTMSLNYFAYPRKSKKGNPKLGLYTRKKAADAYKARVAKVSEVKVKKKDETWADHARKITAKKKDKETVGYILDRGVLGIVGDAEIPEKASDNVATRAAIKDAVVEAKAATLESIKADEVDFFDKKAADELKSLTAMLKDREGADKYLEVRKLRQELEADNAKKLVEAHMKVKTYLGKIADADAEAKGFASKGRLRLSMLGWTVLGTLVSIAAAGGAWFIWG